MPADMTRSLPQSQVRPVQEALQDVYEGFTKWRMWSMLAWQQLRLRYRRTWIGIGWIGVSFALFMVAKIVVFSGLMGRSVGYYAAHLTVGYIIFRLIANAVTGSSAAFVSARTWISSERLPLSLYVYQMMMNNFIIFAITAVPAVLICIWSGTYNLLGILWVLPCFVVYALCTLCTGLFLGVISARYRDAMHFSGTVMSIAYFLTPVLWTVPEEGARATVAMINPFTHFIAILRDPILTGTVPLQSWVIVSGCTVTLVALALVFFTTSRRKIIFWV